MINKNIFRMLIINISINIGLLIFINIFSKMKFSDSLIFSLKLFGFGIFGLLFFILLFYIIYQFNELTFQVFTMSFLIGSFIGIIIICLNLLKDDIVFLSLTMPLINISFLSLYIRIYIWKINWEKYIENKRQNKIKNDNNKISI